MTSGYVHSLRLAGSTHVSSHMFFSNIYVRCCFIDDYQIPKFQTSKPHTPKLVSLMRKNPLSAFLLLNANNS